MSLSDSRKNHPAGTASSRNSAEATASKPEIQFRDDVTVSLVRSSASDLDVIWAAKVSTLGDDVLGAEEQHTKRFLNFLMANRHGSPFEHTSFTFFIEAPIFVWREFMRHRIASYNEESGRYKQLKPVFYIPNDDRKLVQQGKPGAYELVSGTIEQLDEVQSGHMMVSQIAYQNYKRQLDLGIAREVARMTLPLNIYSSAFVTMNARSLMNFLSLRTKREDTVFPSFPQREIEMVAERMEGHFITKMPATWQVFNENGRVAP